MSNHRAPASSSVQRFGTTISPSFLRLLDAWRAAQPEHLSDIDAIRHLAALARLEARNSVAVKVESKVEQPD